MIIGLANGCFDGLHEGHKHLLRTALAQCDYLVIGMNSDASVKRLKGADRPINTWYKRLIDVQLFCIDAGGEWSYSVVPFEGRHENLLMEIRPDVYFVGYDHSAGDLFARKPGWKETLQWDTVKVIQISHLPGYSTTELYAPQRNA